MGHYLFVASYSPDGVRGVLDKGGTARRTAIENVIAEAGGQMLSFHFAFGDDDVYTLVESPSNQAAAAVALAVTAAGRAHVKTVVLLTPEEVDEATKQKVGYVAPGETWRALLRCVGAGRRKRLTCQVDQTARASSADAAATRSSTVASVASS